MTRASGLAWLPEGQRRTLLGYTSWSIEEAGGLFLADGYSLREGFSLTAHICRNCGKGVFDLTEQSPAILYPQSDHPSGG